MYVVSALPAALAPSAVQLVLGIPSFCVPPAPGDCFSILAKVRSTPRSRALDGSIAIARHAAATCVADPTRLLGIPIRVLVDEEGRQSRCLLFRRSRKCEDRNDMTGTRIATIAIDT